MDWLVARCVAVTSALEMTAPVGSVIRPVTDAVVNVSCARARGPQMQMDKIGMRRADCNGFLRLNTIPPDGSASTKLVCGSCFLQAERKGAGGPRFCLDRSQAIRRFASVCGRMDG